MSTAARGRWGQLLLLLYQGRWLRRLPLLWLILMLRSRVGKGRLARAEVGIRGEGGVRSVDLSGRIGLALDLVLRLALDLTGALALGWNLARVRVLALRLTRNSSSCSSPDSGGGGVGSSRRVKGVLGTVAVSAKSRERGHVLSTKQTNRSGRRREQRRESEPSNARPHTTQRDPQFKSRGGV